MFTSVCARRILYRQIRYHVAYKCNVALPICSLQVYNLKFKQESGRATGTQVSRANRTHAGMARSTIQVHNNAQTDEWRVEILKNQKGFPALAPLCRYMCAYRVTGLPVTYYTVQVHMRGVRFRHAKRNKLLVGASDRERDSVRVCKHHDARGE